MLQHHHVLAGRGRQAHAVAGTAPRADTHRVDRAAAQPGRGAGGGLRLPGNDEADVLGHRRALQTVKGFCFRKVATGPIVNRFGVWIAGMPLLMCAWKVA